MVMNHLCRRLAGLTIRTSILSGSRHQPVLSLVPGRNVAHSRPTSGSLILEQLKGRSLIRVHGPQAREFLQSLITNDMNKLPAAGDGSSAPLTGYAIYAMFLNKGGRVLYDTIIYKPKPDEETYLVECDRQIDTELLSHLKVFRVRKKIDIDIVSKERSVWTAFNPLAVQNGNTMRSLRREENVNDVLITSDPRLGDMGSRIIAPSEWTGGDLGLVQGGDGNNRLHRYRLGVGEGITELPVGSCFPLESNADYMNGVSFDKGCYLGQEFTARTHHTGVVRKRLMPVRFTQGKLTNHSSRNVESTHGTVLGKVRGFQSDAGVALLKYEVALKEESPLIFGGANDGTVIGRPVRPIWWPREPPKKK